MGKVSSFFFFSGFVFGKIQNLPIPVVSPALNAVSLTFYMMGYAVWFLASHFYPNHIPKEEEWYGFAQFKEQYLFAATLGLLATGLSIAGFFMPVLLIPAGWTFLASNFMWTSGEYNKLNSPSPHDKNFSYTHQKAYVSYAVTMTAMGFVAALATTAVFLFPPAAIPVLILSSIIVIGLSAFAIENWLDYTFGDHKPTPVVQSSHCQMKNSLGPRVFQEETDSPDHYHGEGLLKSSEDSQSLQPETTPPICVQTCSMR
ncbi:hypothetical protein [Legionella antarctica]|uniref:hypothetical protein n=1 Tax=Legionella antarctica TaxID=2708020 RepID=UPI0015670A8D|nr:hypothetical protein [Legionella antarctica]